MDVFQDNAIKKNVQKCACEERKRKMSLTSVDGNGKLNKSSSDSKLGVNYQRQPS